MSDDMSAYKEVFLSESAEYVQSIVDALLGLEKDPGDVEAAESVFRGAHSLKGMAAAMGYERTTEVTHKMESLMETVRSGRRAPDAAAIDLMLRAVDILNALIQDESADAETVDVSDIVAEIDALTESDADVARVSMPAPTATDRSSDTEPPLYRVVVTLEEGCVLKSVRAYMVIKRLAHVGTVVDTVPSARAIEDEKFDRTFEVIVQSGVSEDELSRSALAVSEVEKAEVDVVERDVGDAEGATADRSQTTLSLPKLSETQTVRVSIGHLDSLVNLVGELVILRSRLDRLTARMDSRELAETIEELRGVSAELQHEVMQARMVPVGNIFNRFPRMVRDLSKDLGKEVAFEMDGLDIELDRTVLDEIGDPIVHLLRNSVDHGIESPKDRAAEGKPKRGQVWLTAMREREHVRIVVADDGRGMSVDRIWDKACDMGFVERGQRGDFTDQEIMLFACASGFSTAEEVTKLSGRGVGMDVVKGKIEYLGGHLAVNSTPGKGTEVSLVLPLTLAIIPALMLGADEQTYALPLASVDEVLAPDDVTIETVDGAPVVVLRDGRVAPLQDLATLLKENDHAHRLPRPGDHVVLVSVTGAIRALLVERILGRQEVVIKPLTELFRGVRGVGGATVLGDGRVALILDPRSLFPGREEFA